MDVLSAEFWTALLSIIIIDLLLAGDNAIVIGLAARNLPKHQQKKAIIWGTAGAVVVRALATIFVVWLLKIPGLLLVGGLLLVWIAYKLLVEEKGHDDIEAGGSLWEAMRTIIIADALMGLDNVLAVAGAAHGNFLLVILGLLISVPIMVWGSTFILKWIERFPIIITIGAGVLAWTAAKMIVDEPFLKAYFANPAVKYGFELLVVAAVIVAGTIKKRKSAKETKPKAANE
ncbi:TerC family protein [Geobacillus sp. FSL K6-0789]|uniref:Membrane protein n=2 Tax=Geobacillus stearothermophilus TaxID=1422 RepID=A0A0K9HEF2_GEOSE|nr:MULTISPECIES: TerC family protein [Geobacillus]KAF6511143.1 putative membrane protein [Geobacillus stearothermophilus]KMY57345.1 membrane protein [Geobacillus stearothermophilus]KMY59234.1 membrane protein [Geobacillus stearothermophilus]KMY64923.1 membrane protein [Geobacillus stearothermophilus]KOR94259.1 membrane protein [Geobacillus stearothermophilus ATCC 12980]